MSFFVYIVVVFYFFTDADYRNSLFTFSVQNREDLGLIDGSVGDKIEHNGIYKVFKGVGFLSLFLYIIFRLNKMKNRTISFWITLLLCIIYTLRTGIGMSSVSRWNMIIGLIVGCIILMNFFHEKSRAIKKVLFFYCDSHRVGISLETLCCSKYRKKHWRNNELLSKG